MCLAAESFGSRLCYAEKTQFTPRENEVLRPAKISDCVFVINQALSLRALQEILTHAKSQQEVRIPTLNDLFFTDSALNCLLLTAVKLTVTVAWSRGFKMILLVNS